ncbi:MAG: DUF4393 domain-containing protein [Acidobacteriia bacterium]|nr:DUF4393 domain-containing protein [Terriglobia bacterium]
MGKIDKALVRILQNLAGPAAGEVTDMIGDESRPLRAERQLKLIRKTARMIEEGGYEACTIPENILLAVLDHASGEDNEKLHTVWAALLANAARLDDRPKITPLFVEILRQLSPSETTFLISLHDFVEREYGIDKDILELPAAQSIALGTDVDLLIKYLRLGLGRPKETREQALINIPGDLRDFMVILDNLERLNLLSYRLDMEAPGWGLPTDVKGIDPVRIYHLTMLGYQFIRACRLPS